jgi:hypothetical protein
MIRLSHTPPLPNPPARAAKVSPPPCGEGMGVGVMSGATPCVWRALAARPASAIGRTSRVFTPPLTPPRQGEGNPGGARGIVRALICAALFAGLVALLTASNAHAQPAEVTFDLKIEKGRVAQNMRLIRVKQGDAVRLRWSADHPIALHLHGYDIEVKVEPGKTADMAFTARATGRFPIEEHKPDARGGHSHGEAPLARIEVYPR